VKGSGFGYELAQGECNSQPIHVFVSMGCHALMMGEFWVGFLARRWFWVLCAGLHLLTRTKDQFQENYGWIGGCTASLSKLQ
jgi:hypothetical protein